MEGEATIHALRMYFSLAGKRASRVLFVLAVNLPITRCMDSITISTGPGIWRINRVLKEKVPQKVVKNLRPFSDIFFTLNGIYMYFLFCFETFHLFNWPSPMPVPKRKMSCSQPELLAHNILYLMFGRQWFLLLELKIIFLQNNISFKVRIRWTGKNSKQKKLQRSLCEVRETFIEKICTVYPERNGNWNTVVRHTGNLFMCLGPGCGYTIGYLTGMHR